MVSTFALSDADITDIPDRLRSRGWLAAAAQVLQPSGDRLGKLVPACFQPPLEFSWGLLLEGLLTKPDRPATTVITPIRFDWYLFFSVSPPLPLRGTHHG